MFNLASTLQLLVFVVAAQLLAAVVPGGGAITRGPERVGPGS